MGSKSGSLHRVFGTDGIRGCANESPMTSEIALQVGRAVAYVLQREAALQSRTSMPVGLKPLESRRSVRRARIVVGKDTRLSGYMIEMALASGILSMGADVIIIGPLPTPGVAFVTQSMRADAGIMISASHNPFNDNGIKIFASDGYKFPDHLERQIEELIQSDELLQGRPTGDLVGKAFRIEEAHGRYLVFLKSLFPRELDLLGMRVALDCANGAAYRVAPLVFEELGAEVIRRGVSPNGININENCGALHPEAVSLTTNDVRADIGVALDGDGDRCVLIDETGEIVDGDQVIGILALELARTQKLTGSGIVTTPMSNLGLELRLKEEGIEMHRAPVGDRHVVELMRNKGINFGGEQSGHIIFLDHSTTGDGIVTALKVMEVIRRRKKPLSELKREIPLFPQVRRDVRVKRREEMKNLPNVQKAIQESEIKLKGRGRVFVRFSGTEALARVLVEGEDVSLLQACADTIAQELSHACGGAS